MYVLQITFEYRQYSIQFYVTTDNKRHNNAKFTFLNETYYVDISSHDYIPVDQAVEGVFLIHKHAISNDPDDEFLDFDDTLSETISVDEEAADILYRGIDQARRTIILS
mgnify:CR=1 FL=1